MLSIKGHRETVIKFSIGQYVLIHLNQDYFFSHPLLIKHILHTLRGYVPYVHISIQSDKQQMIIFLQGKQWSYSFLFQDKISI